MGRFGPYRFESFITAHLGLVHVRSRVRTPGRNGSRERGFGTLTYERLCLDEIDDVLLPGEGPPLHHIIYKSTVLECFA